MLLIPKKTIFYVNSIEEKTECMNEKLEHYAHKMWINFYAFALWLIALHKEEGYNGRKKRMPYNRFKPLRYIILLL